MSFEKVAARGTPPDAVHRPAPSSDMRPRVMCFLHSLEPGGVERTALRLCDGWARHGVDVDVVLGRRGGAMEAGAPGLRCHVPDGRLFPRRRLETLWMILTLPRLIRQLRPDLLFCAGNTYAVVAVMMRLLLGRACPPIVAKISNDLERRDMPWPLRPLYHAWCRLQGRLIDRFIALSPAMRHEVIRVAAVSPRRVSCIHDPVLTDVPVGRARRSARPKHAPPDEARHFIAIGRMVRQKHFEGLLRAFRAAAAPNDRLTILGDGPRRRALERLVARGGLSDRVALPGHVDDAARHLAMADIFILSSLYEGLPAVVVEAIAAGLPVIATDCCASMRPLLDAVGGTTVPVRDHAALTRAIAESVPGIASSDGTAAIVALHMADRSILAYLDLFEQALRARPADRAPRRLGAIDKAPSAVA